MPQDLKKERKLQRQINVLIIAFMSGMVLSGITAFPIETELAFVQKRMHWFPDFTRDWLSQVYFAVQSTNANFPFLSYGTDWLAFGHLVIATAFLGPLKDPIKNIWVIQFGMISCILVIPLAFIAGYVREIPFYWRLIDCAFGVIGMIILYPCYCNILKLKALKETANDG